MSEAIPSASIALETHLKKNDLTFLFVFIESSKCVNFSLFMLSWRLFVQNIYIWSDYPMFQHSKVFLISTALNTSIYLYFMKAHCFKYAGTYNKNKESKQLRLPLTIYTFSNRFWLLKTSIHLIFLLLFKNLGSSKISIVSNSPVIYILVSFLFNGRFGSIKEP